jgi:FkbM family methyltransferase
MPFQPQSLDRAAFDAALDEAGAALQAKRPRLDRLAGERRVVVYTYGARGAHLAEQLRACDVECLVFDNGAESRKRAARDGFETLAAVPDGLPLIVGAGQSQIEILDSLGERGDVHTLQEALWAFDLINSYGPARAFTAVVAERRDDLFERHAAMDPDSQAAFAELLAFRASLDVRRLTLRRPMHESWLPPVVLDVRSFCDVGAYDGDTLAALKGAYPGLERTFTVEPNPDLQAPIAETARRLGLDNRAFQGAAWSGPARLGAATLDNRMMVIREDAQGAFPAEALDALTDGEAYDYVKFDVEGAEAQAIVGGADLLRRARGVAVAAYHYPEDIIDLPARLEALLGDGWRHGFRHYSESFEDSVVYAWRDDA